MLKNDPELNEPPALLAEDESEADDDEGTNKSPLWKALINLMGDLEGTGTLALPYVISQSGLIAISGLIIIPFIAFYTGAILIDCLYDQNDAGERVRVRSNYKQLGEACSSRYSGTIVSAIQLIHLFPCGVSVPCTMVLRSLRVFFQTSRCPTNSGCLLQPLLFFLPCF